MRLNEESAATAPARYFESRGGKFDEVVFFGLQYFMKRYLQGKATLPLYCLQKMKRHTCL